MNKDNRKRLQEAIDLIEQGKAIIEEIKDGEQQKYDNLSEGLQQSGKGQAYEENANELDEAISDIDDAVSKVTDVLMK